MAGPSTRAVGDAFEAYAMRYLNSHLKMFLRNVGGRGDGGVDLRGDWWLPKPLPPDLPEAMRVRNYKTSPASDLRVVAPGLNALGLPDPDLIAPLRVVVQCKAEANKIGPRHVRELNGVLLHIAGQRVHPTAANEQHHPAEPAPHIGIHVSQSGFTPGAMQAASASTEPLMLVHLDGGRVGGGPVAETKSGVRSLWYNAPFGGLLNDRRLEIRQLQRPPPAAAGVGLYYAGEKMERFGPPLDWRGRERDHLSTAF